MSLGIRFFCRNMTSGLLIIAIKSDRRNGIITPCAAFKPAITITRHATNTKGLVCLFGGSLIRLILGRFFK